jgi:hypothetical protein
LRVPPDTLQVPPDSALAQAGLQEVPGDSINPQDTLPALQLPGLARPTPVGWATGIWEWNRDEILGSKATTLAELVGEVPGTVMLRGGDYGMPVSVTAFGAGGDRIRVFQDGIEVVPLEGSTPDLTRIGLAGLRSVRVVRGVGDLRIELERILVEGGRPLSLVEAGTGDLNTNLFRGTFAHPRAFGGSMALALDRVDTKGPQGQELSRMSAERGDLYSPESASRTDWSVRSRWTLFPGVVGDLFLASSSLKTDGVRALSRLQRNSGEGIPKTSAFLEISGGIERFGGLSAEMEWEQWEGESVSRARLRAWTAPLFGLSLFTERSSGRWGLPYLRHRPLSAPDTVSGGEEPPAADTVPQALPGPRFSDNEGTRVGLSYSWRGLSLAGARVSVTSDSLFNLGLPQDRAGEVRPGGTRDGFEISGRIPLFPRGFALVGSYQWWDQEEDVLGTPADSLAQAEPLPEEDLPWRYLPRRSYEGSLSFHDTFYPTENLEIWFDLGVKGRDPMALPFSEAVELEGGEATVPSMAPFYQSWFVRLQIRVVSVRAFIMWENFTVRPSNQDFLGRILPSNRSLYGVRWTMWN